MSVTLKESRTQTPQSNQSQTVSPEHQELVGRLLSSGAYWSVSKAIGKALGIKETILLMELVTFADYFKDDTGWFWKTREQLEKATGFCQSTQYRKEEILMSLGFFDREQRGQNRNNWYFIHYTRILELIKDPNLFMTTNKHLIPQSSMVLVPRNSIGGKGTNDVNGEYVDEFRTEKTNSQEVKKTVSSSQKDSTYNNNDYNNDNFFFINKKEKGNLNITPSGDIETNNTNNINLNKIENDKESCSLQSQDMSAKNRQTPANTNIDIKNYSDNTITIDKALEISAPAPNLVSPQVSPTEALHAALKNNPQALAPRPPIKAVSKRKLHSDTIKVIEYWNSKPELRNHRIEKDAEGVYRWYLQTNMVKTINETIPKLMRGELYTKTDDIVHMPVKSRKWTLPEIFTAIDRQVLGTSLEYCSEASKANKSKKPSLDSFFYNVHSKVYPEKPQTMYKYKYPFLYYVAGELEKPEINLRKTDNDGIVKAVVRRFQENGMRFSNYGINDISRAVDAAMVVLNKNKSKWKLPETKMLMEFPSVFCACFRANSNGSGIKDLWKIANYKLEGYLSEKGYI